MNIRTWHQARERKRREARRLARTRVFRAFNRKMEITFRKYAHAMNEFLLARREPLWKQVVSGARQKEGAEG